MRVLSPLLLVFFLCLSCSLILVACDDDDDDDDDDDGIDCEQLYEDSLVNQCMDYSTFEFHGCSPEEDLTDPECFLDCIAELEDGELLCFNAEQCSTDCSTDDATGCENAYYGMTNQECLSYQEFFLQACDLRVESSYRACVSNCYENEPDCDSFDACVLGCDG